MTDVLDLTRKWARSQLTYTLRASCGNCGWAGIVRLNRGHKRPGSSLAAGPATCPDCDCDSVVARPRKSA